jgi:integrase
MFEFASRFQPYNPDTGTRWLDVNKPWRESRIAAGYLWLRIRDLRPAFGIKAADKGVPMHFIQSVLGHSSVAVTEKYYANFSPAAAVPWIQDRSKDSLARRGVSKEAADPK